MSSRKVLTIAVAAMIAGIVMGTLGIANAGTKVAAKAPAAVTACPSAANGTCTMGGQCATGGDCQTGGACATGQQCPKATNGACDMAGQCTTDGDRATGGACGGACGSAGAGQ